MIDAIEFCLINVVALNIDTAYNRGCCQTGSSAVWLARSVRDADIDNRAQNRGVAQSG